MGKSYLEMSLKNYSQTNKEARLPILRHQVFKYGEVVRLHTSASLDVTGAPKARGSQTFEVLNLNCKLRQFLNKGRAKFRTLRILSTRIRKNIN